jgi:hypothetical protein
MQSTRQPHATAVPRPAEVVEPARLHRFTTPTVHELTPAELDRQKGLVRMSLLLTPITGNLPGASS